MSLLPHAVCCVKLVFSGTQVKQRVENLAGLGSRPVGGHTIEREQSAAVPQITAHQMFYSGGRCGWRIYSWCFPVSCMRTNKLLTIVTQSLLITCPKPFEVFLVFFLLHHWVCEVGMSLLDSWGLYAPVFPALHFSLIPLNPLHHWLDIKKKKFPEVSMSNWPKYSFFEQLSWCSARAAFSADSHCQKESYYNLAAISKDQGQLRQWLQVMSILRFQTS